MPATALVVVVPEVEHLVAALRLRHDALAARGVPAHVTVLFPFVSPIDERTVERVARVVCQQPPFVTRFAAVDHFPGMVVWLRPEPSAPFSALIAAAVAEFPERPPDIDDIVEPIPHLTVANGVDAATASRITHELGPRLPIRCQINELALLGEDETGCWTVARTWPLGRAPRRKAQGTAS
jgi:hypothetical protein